MVDSTLMVTAPNRPCFKPLPKSTEYYSNVPFYFDSIIVVYFFGNLLYNQNKHDMC